MALQGRRLPLVLALLLLAWLGQFLWLAWNFAPEVRDLARKLLSRTWGESLREQDPLVQEARQLAALMPPEATYLYLDRYEAGRYLQLRYLLHPRRQIRLNPAVTPTRLYDEVRRWQATFLVIQGWTAYPRLDFLFSADPRPFRRLWEAAPVVVFATPPAEINSSYYD